MAACNITKKVNGGRVMFWNKGNAHFLNRKVEIEIAINKFSPIIIGILEANLEIPCHKPALNITGYSLEMDSRALTNLTVRTLVYIKDGMNFKRRTDLEPNNSSCIWLELKTTNKKPWLVFTGYREWAIQAPSGKYVDRSPIKQQERLTEWGKGWECASLEAKPVLLLGDMNVDVTPWLYPDITPTTYQNSQEPLLTLLTTLTNENGMEIIETAPTRRQGKGPPSRLDLIITNRPQLVNNIEILPSGSDHSMVSLRINQKEPIPPKSQKDAEISNNTVRKG